MTPAQPATAPWRPRGCGVECLSLTMTATVSWIRRAIRLLGLTGAVLLFMGLCAVTTERNRLVGRVVPWGARTVVRAVGVRLRVIGDAISPGGDPDQPGLLVVSNHMSWLDSLVIQAAYGPLRMLSMVEVRSWPMLGWISNRSGTLYIDRDRLSRLPQTMTELAAALQAGHNVGAFPESVTSCGVHRLPFRNAVFQAAIDADADVAVIELEYRAMGVTTVQPGFLGTESASASLLRVAGARGLTAELSCRLLPSGGPYRTRRALREEAEAATDALAHR